MMFMDAVSSWSMLKLSWSDLSVAQDIDFYGVSPSRFFEVHCSTTARWIKFIFRMVFTDAVNSRYTLNFSWSDLSIDQNIDFYACESVTFFGGSLFNNGVTDWVHIWNDVYWCSKFSIYVKVFMIRSVYWSGYRFFCECVGHVFFRFTAQQRRDGLSSYLEWCSLMQ